MFVGHVREPCKTAESIEMPFGWVTRVGPSNHVKIGGQTIQGEVAILGGFPDQ